MSRWDLPVPESPIRHSGCPLRIQSQVARVWMVAGLMFGLASKSKSASHLSRGNPAALTRRTERRRVHLQGRVHPHHRVRQRREPDQRRAVGNVFWQVGSSATLGTHSTLRGTVMALASITVTTGVTVDGRALARTAAVTLDTNTITNPTTGPPPVGRLTLVDRPTPVDTARPLDHRRSDSTSPLRRPRPASGRGRTFPDMPGRPETNHVSGIGHPQGGAGRGVEHGMTMLGRACADQRRWQHQHPTRALGIAVNISTQQLMAAGFPDTVAAVLKKEHLEPKLLTLEVTESVFVWDSKRA